MKITDIYDKYKIMPQLRTHMFRVSGVASLICGNFQKPIDKNSIISACLLHDMGNAIKFNFVTYPKLLDEKLVIEGKKIQKYFIKKYGSDVEKATYKIIEDIDVSQRVTQLVKSIGFVKTINTFNSTDYEIKICEYSDMRVSPFGIVSMKERLDEGIKRYNHAFKEKYKPDELKKMVNYLIQIEKQIFERCKIKPEDITKEKVKPLLEKLRNFEIKTNKT